MSKRIDISYKTVLFITGFIILLWILYLIRDVILLFFVAFIFMSALSPTVEKLEKKRMPKPLAILIAFLVSIVVLAGIITLGFTPLINQTSRLTQKLADTISLLLSTSLIDQSIINQELSNLSRQVISFGLSLFENLIGFVSVIVIAFYLLLDRAKIEERFASLFLDKQERVKKLIFKIEDKLGAWLRGQLILSLVVGVLVYIGLLALGMEFALSLAIIAALLEVVPVIGPIIAAIPAVLLALTISPVFAAVVAGLYLSVQQIENHIVVPQVMKRAVGLNPLLVILAISVGGRLLGVAGAFLAVPITVVLQVVVEDVLRAQETSQPG